MTKPNYSADLVAVAPISTNTSCLFFSCGRRNRRKLEDSDGEKEPRTEVPKQYLLLVLARSECGRRRLKTDEDGLPT